ncbi:lactococcin 972 family bacteriocin [Rathayibacter sp. ZW T2_19]|uniref:Lactococcin 972 family bacteriocin n=1 Tax=Rathayibacter rubneri TaxID=2950106 RepID=A0A9X2DYF6_9MICO|nr:lactococcin 972 family bacteriocin [Rathayibacter rubneri]MCM6762968.1 lactococcin 972 family bacteriocin [Rathayibacter rubneri]
MPLSLTSPSFSRAPGSRRSFVAALALAGTMLVAPAAAAAYTTAYPEGGTWYYGVSNGTVLSSYNHPSRSHRASVDNGRIHRSACKGRNVPASVSAPARPFIVDRAYYAFC